MGYRSTSAIQHPGTLTFTGAGHSDENNYILFVYIGRAIPNE